MTTVPAFVAANPVPADVTTADVELTVGIALFGAVVAIFCVWLARKWGKKDAGRERRQQTTALLKPVLLDLESAIASLTQVAIGHLAAASSLTDEGYQEHADSVFEFLEPDQVTALRAGLTQLNRAIRDRDDANGSMTAGAARLLQRRLESVVQALEASSQS